MTWPNPRWSVVTIENRPVKQKLRHAYGERDRGVMERRGGTGMYVSFTLS